MKPDFSLLITGIRPFLWYELYQSLLKATTRSFEVIFVGPYELPTELRVTKNVKFIKDWGNVSRCFNIGLLVCEAPLLTYVADDATFLNQNLDLAIDEFERMGDNPKNVLILKYTEGTHETQPDSYYYLRNAYPPNNAVGNKDWLIFNFTLMRTAYMKHLGGLDARFSTSAPGHADLTIRANYDGCNAKLFPTAIVHNTHGIYNDHKVIEDSFNSEDMPLYVNIHNNPQNRSRVCIDLNNWMNSPSVWRRRFG